MLVRYLKRKGLSEFLMVDVPKKVSCFEIARVVVHVQEKLC